jgi:hypothetical protein
MYFFNVLKIFLKGFVLKGFISISTLISAMFKNVTNTSIKIIIRHCYMKKFGNTAFQIASEYGP